MKKAKFLFSLLGISLVLATVSAFKVSKYSTRFIYVGELNSGICTVRVDGAAIVGGPTPIVDAWISPLTTGCKPAGTTTIAD